MFGGLGGKGGGNFWQQMAQGQRGMMGGGQAPGGFGNSGARMSGAGGMRPQSLAGMGGGMMGGGGAPQQGGGMFSRAAGMMGGGGPQALAGGGMGGAPGMLGQQAMGQAPGLDQIRRRQMALQGAGAMPNMGAGIGSALGGFGR